MSLQGIATAQPMQAPGSRGVVAVDVDEVLCRYCEAFVAWVTGRPAPADAGQCFRMCYAPELEAARAAFLDTEAFVEIDRVVGAFEGLCKLQALGFDLQAVTARPESVRGATERYLAKYFPGLVSRVHIAQAPFKGRVCRAIRARVLIDDQLANAYDAAQHGLQAIIFDAGGTYAWNHAPALPPNVVRKYDWVQSVDWIVQVCTRTMAPSAPLQVTLPQQLQPPMQPLHQKQHQVAVLSQPGVVRGSGAVPVQMGHRYIVQSDFPAPVAQPAGGALPPQPVVAAAVNPPPAPAAILAVATQEQGGPLLDKLYGTDGAASQPAAGCGGCVVQQASMVERPRGNENAAPPNGFYGYSPQVVHTTSGANAPAVSPPPPPQPAKPAKPEVVMPTHPFPAVGASAVAGCRSGTDGDGTPGALVPPPPVQQPLWGPAGIEQTMVSALPASVVRRPSPLRGAIARADVEAVEQAADPDMTPAAPARPMEIVLEAMCTFGFDVTILPMQFRRLSWRTDERQSFAFGRQSQFDMLAALVPDDFLRNYVSRAHFELVWRASALYMRKLTPNIVLVDGACVPPGGEVRLGRVSTIGFCGPDGLSPFLQMQVKIVEAAVLGDAASAALQRAMPAAPPSPKANLRHMTYQRRAHVPVPRQASDCQSTAAPVAAAVALPVAATPEPAAAVLAEVPSEPAAAPAMVALHVQAFASLAEARPSEETGAHLALTCVGARGLQPGASMDSLDIPAGATFYVGRHHQPGFFDKVLGSEPRFMSYVSRSHIELKPLSIEGGLYDVRNLSINPIMVEGKQLDKGEEARVQVPANIDFVAGEEGVCGAISYLSLRLERVCLVRGPSVAIAMARAATSMASSAGAATAMGASLFAGHAYGGSVEAAMPLAPSPLPDGIEAKLMESPLFGGFERPRRPMLPQSGDLAQMHLPQMQQCSA